MIAQRTLRQSVRATGVGLHSGEPVSLLLKPASINTGIRFVRTDLNPPVEISAKANVVVHSPLCTALENHKGSARVATIEHLMAALCGLGIDNLIIEINAAEVPIMDGSASPFVFLIQSAGIVEQDAPKSFISIQRKVRVQEGDKWAEFRPYAGFKMTFSIDFNHPAIRSRNQKMSADVSSRYFTRELSRARTFGFLKDVEAL
ncbi:MAG: UDP-3-O-acyl-N-acetylglucosamine deacetylase, partial [Pseudomonadota bacterium]